MKPGDLIGFSANGCLGFWINVGTWGIPWWSLSHVGIVADAPRDKRIIGPDGKLARLLLYESTVSCPFPCAVLGYNVTGVQAQHIEQRIESYDGRVWHYPLSFAIGTNQRLALQNHANFMLGHAYDFEGAAAARSLGLGWLQRRLLKSPEDLSSLYCSEFCAACEEQAGVIALDNASVWSPNRLVRHMRHERVLSFPRRLK